MRIVTVDFETYYDQDYSLSKLTTEQYIRSPLFEIIGMGIKEDSQPARWVDSADVRDELDRISWGGCAILAHNTFFDGAILSWHFGIKPKLWLDTMSMSKPFHMVETGGGLAPLVIHYGLGEKGSEVKEARGKHRVDFDFASLVRYSQYCLNDVELTFKLYQVLAAKMPAAEVAIIHQNICMFVNPVLELDARGLQQHMEILQTKQADLVRECGVPVDVLRSNDKFANFLRSEGVVPPQAISSKTKVLTWAFNKSQPEFVKLMEHPNARVAKAVAARLGVRSTIEFTRAQSLLGVSARGKLPVMLNYYGAHTGRDSGGDRLNLQNLPRNGTLRRCIRAPRGYKLLAADLSQIEARITAWLAGETGLLEDFMEQDLNPNATEDVYTKFASKLYGCTITKADKAERFVGKTCILGLGYGMSGSKLSLTLSNAPGVNLQVDRRDADGYVSTYRREFGRIPQLWEGMGKILTIAEKKQEGYINLNSEFDISTADGEIKLPNGLAIRYPGLVKTKKFGWGGEEFFYARSGAALNKYIADVLIKGMAETANSCREYMTHLHGAAAVENLVQALANIILKRAGLFVAQKYPLVLRVHDEVVALIPEEDELTAVEFVRSCMTKRVSWAPTLPINCEIGVADNYGDC